MLHFNKMSKSVVVVTLMLASILAVAFVSAANSGVDNMVAVRTYLFWALVCAPVAYLAEMVGRSMLQYRVVRRVLARVEVTSKSRRYPDR